MSRVSGRGPGRGRDQQFVTDVTLEGLADERLRRVFAYWLSCRPGDALPPVAAIDPLALPREALPWITVLEVEREPLRFRSRLVGTAVAEAIGLDHTGRYVAEQPGMEGQHARFTWCVETRHPYLAAASLSWSPRAYKSYRTLALPFADAEGRVARIVHVFVFD